MTTKALYGSKTGRWAVVDVADGLVPPPVLPCMTGGRPVDLVYLGSPADSVARVYGDFGNGDGGSAQRRLGDLLGVSQSTVSRYLAGTLEPALSDAGWTRLVLLEFGVKVPA
jgi:hypothetical protein